jgi:ABC-type branched-subunit amino acid transport system substrate-binding protein
MKQRRFGMHRLALGIVVVVGAAVVAISASAAGSKKPTGSPLDIWAIAPIGTPLGDIPMVQAGISAAARYVNGQGGVGKAHHRLVVKICNTQATPNGELQCAQQAGADANAIAAVNAVPLFNGTAFTQQLQKDGLPNINPFINTPDQFVNPINFPLLAAAFNAAACSVLAPKAARLSKVGDASINLPISTDTANAAQTAAKNAGFDPVGVITFPVTVTDLAPYIRQLQSKDPQLVVLGMQPQLVGQFVSTAVQLGSHWTYCGQDGIVFYQNLVALGSAADNFYFAAQLPEIDEPEGYPLIQEFRREATAEFNAGNKAASLEPTALPQNTFSAWLGTQVVIQVVNTMKGPVNRKRFLAALNKATVTFGTGKGQVLRPIDFAKPNPNPKYSRLFNTWVFLKKWNPNTKQIAVVKSIKPIRGDALVP